NRRTDFDWISRDSAEVDLYIADKWCGFDVTAGLWCDLSYAFLELERPENVAKVRADLPVRIMSGGDDPIHDKRKGLDALVRLYQERGFAKLDVEVYEGARHELLNETNRDEVTRDLVDWITSVVTPQ
ncbi:MAG: alpha/beta hydrolase, partial [Myxococcota bacterium]